MKLRLPATAAARGIALMMLSTVAFTLMHTLVRYVSAELHPFEIAFFRNAFGILVFIPWLLRQGFAPLATRRFPLHGLRAVMNMIAMFAFFMGLSLTPLAQATALGFTAPVFGAVFGVLLLGERIRLRRWAAIAVGLAGTLLILRPGLVALELGPLLVVGSALLWAATMMVIKVLGRTDSSITITTYANVLLAAFSLAPALLVWRTPEGDAWLWLALIGLLGTLGQLALAQALKETEAGVIMPFDFLKLIWAALLGYLLFAEVPDLFVWIGGAAIVASTTYIALRERRRP